MVESPSNPLDQASLHDTRLPRALSENHPGSRPLPHGGSGFSYTPPGKAGLEPSHLSGDYILRLVTILTVLVVICGLGTGQAALGAERTEAQQTRIENQQARAKVIICKVFGPYCQQALRVSWCESHWYVWAGNGQYLGIFQMGKYARGKYGHGPGAWKQARAAKRYFDDSGRDWSPWSCKP